MINNMEDDKKIYADFNSLDGNLLLLDSIKTTEDLKKNGIELKEGQKYIFYDFDEDDNNKPNHMCALGIVKYDNVKKKWFAEIDREKLYWEKTE